MVTRERGFKPTKGTLCRLGGKNTPIATRRPELLEQNLVVLIEGIAFAIDRVIGAKGITWSYFARTSRLAPARVM